MSKGSKRSEIGSMPKADSKGMAQPKPLTDEQVAEIVKKAYPGTMVTRWVLVMEAMDPEVLEAGGSMEEALFVTYESSDGQARWHRVAILDEVLRMLEKEAEAEDEEADDDEG